MSAAAALAPVHDEQPHSFDARRRAFFAGRGVDLDAQAISFLLFRTQADVFSAMERAALRPLGLTHAGFTMMLTLWISGPMETRQLARALGVSRPSVVSVANTLETRGLTRRARSDADRRLVTVGLTAKGERLVAGAQRETHVYERRLAGAMSEHEQRTLMRLLGKLDRAARDLLDEQAPKERR